jgi:hypothetical protein
MNHVSSLNVSGSLSGRPSNNIRPAIYDELLLVCGLLCPYIYAVKSNSAVCLKSEPGSSVSIVFGYGLDDRAIEVQSLAVAKGIFL